MTTQIDWQQEIDASFGTGEDQPVGHYVAVGQHAVRRRRRAGLVGGLAAAAVVVGVAWAVAPGGDPTSSEVPVATDPSGTTSASAPDAMAWVEDEVPVRFLANGVDVRPGAVVHQRRDDLYPGKATDSAALDVSFQGQRWWVSLEWDGNGGVTNVVLPEEGLFPSFEAFVADRVRGGGMITEAERPDDVWLGGLVQWDGQTIIERKGVEALRTVQDPLGDGASIGVVLTKDGTTTWMLITDDGAGATWIEESGSGWATFEEWLVDQVAMTTGTEAPNPVRLDGSTIVAALPGVTVLEQQADPDLRAYGTADTGATSAVGLIEWKGRRWFVLVIDDSVNAVARDKTEGATTLDDFVAFMADRADEGGMR